MNTITAQECWEKVVKYSERVLDTSFSRGQRALWDHLADSWRACAQRVEILEQDPAEAAPGAAAPPAWSPPGARREHGADPNLPSRP